MIIFESNLKEMKKILLLAALTIFTYGAGIGQVFYSGFENWTDPNTPSDWRGAATSALTTEVVQYSTTPQSGTYCVQLINATTSHKRLSTQAVSVTAGEVYNVSYYARGTGEVRVGMYRGATGSYVSYSSYAVINSASWTKVDQVIMCDTTSSAAEFILSFRNTTATYDNLQIDSFYVSVGTSSTVSIHDIQYTTGDSSTYYGDPVNTGGIVSATKSGAYWIQNGTGPWSGVYVYDAVNTPAIGDSITFSAIVDEYYSLTELKSISNYVKVSSGNPVQVTELNLPDAPAEMYEGVLVKVSNVECMSLPDTYLEWTVGDGMSTLKVGDLIYAYTPTIGTNYDVTGVMDYNFSEWKIQPRSASDVTIHNAIGEFEINASVYPNPTSDNVNISANAEGTIRIADVTGRIVFEAPFNQNAIVSTQSFNSGVYSVIINGNDGTFATTTLLVK